jgi:hypothetical protein
MLLPADPLPVMDDPVLAGLRAGTVGPGPGAAKQGELTADDDCAGPAPAVDGAATGTDPLEAPLADELAQDGFPVAVAVIGAVDDAGGVVDDTACAGEETGAVMVVAVVLAGGTVAVVVGGGLGGGRLVAGVVVVVMEALGGAGVASGVVDGAAAGCGVASGASVASTPAVAGAAAPIRARNTNTAAKSTVSSRLLKPTAVAPVPVRTRDGPQALPEADGPGHGATVSGRVHGREPHDQRGGGPAVQPA